MPGTLPDQTPVNFIKAGDTGLFFSAKCVQLLVEAKMDPDDFGTYDHVQGKIRKAKDKVQNRKEGDPPPTEHEQYLARCDSGHLMQDAVAREANQRGNMCKNVITGFDSHRAPSCPMEGPSSNPATEHGQITIMERRQAGAVADAQTPPVEPRKDKNAVIYDKGQRQADEDKRVDRYVDMHQERLKDSRKDTLPESRGQSIEEELKKYQSVEALEAAGAKGVDGQRPGTFVPPKEAQIDAESAADCINAWRKAAETEMKKQVQGDYNANPAAANPPPGVSAAQHGANLEHDRRAKWKQYFDAERAGAPETELAAKRADAMAATRARNKFCTAQQGQMLANGQVNDVGRIPCDATVTKGKAAPQPNPESEE